MTNENIQPQAQQVLPVQQNSKTGADHKPEVEWPKKLKSLFTSISQFTMNQKRIGKGAFSTVHKAIENKTGKIFAIKKVSKSPLTNE